MIRHEWPCSGYRPPGHRLACDWHDRGSIRYVVADPPEAPLGEWRYDWCRGSLLWGDCAPCDVGDNVTDDTDFVVNLCGRSL